MFAVVLGCVFCNLSTAAYLSERKRVHTGTLLNSSPGKATVHRGQGKGEKVQAGQNQHMPGCKVYFCPTPPTSKKDFLVRSRRMVYNT